MMFMNLDIIIGNPPYNNDIYLDFVQTGYEALKDDGVMVMITPAKWQAKGGEKNELFREQIVPHMKEIVYYPVCWEVFNDDNSKYAKIHGGVSIYSIDKEAHCAKVKVMSDVAKALNDNADGFNGTLFGESTRSIIRKTHTDSKIRVERIKNKWYRSEIYAVCGEVFSWGGFLNKDGQTFVLLEPYMWNGKDDISSDTMIIGQATNESEARSIISFVNTRLVRFLIWISCVGQHCGQDYTWRFVPAPDAFDHIFTDAELYQKYGLTDEEINIIESVIKERK